MKDTPAYFLITIDPILSRKSIFLLETFAQHRHTHTQINFFSLCMWWGLLCKDQISKLFHFIQMKCTESCIIKPHISTCWNLKAYLLKDGNFFCMKVSLFCTNINKWQPFAQNGLIFKILD